MMDVLRSKDTEIKSKLQAEQTEALRKKRFDAVILDRPWSALNEGLKSYVFTGQLFENDSVFQTLTGLRTRPQFCFEPKP
jgi:hypothetical protein